MMESDKCRCGDEVGAGVTTAGHCPHAILSSDVSVTVRIGMLLR